MLHFAVDIELRSALHEERIAIVNRRIHRRVPVEQSRQIDRNVRAVRAHQRGIIAGAVVEQAPARASASSTLFENRADIAPPW